jgi:hypothetical protein
MGEMEVDLREFAEKGEDAPLGKVYRVRIDDVTVRVETPHPTGRMLLGLAGKRPCAFELIEEFIHGENRVVEPEETISLHRRGLKGFITAHKEIVTIFIGGEDHPFLIERGERTVAEILAKVGKSADSYELLEEKNGPPMPVAANRKVHICGCEMFFVQPQSGGSS